MARDRNSVFGKLIIIVFYCIVFHCNVFSYAGPKQAHNITGRCMVGNVLCFYFAFKLNLSKYNIKTLKRILQLQVSF